MDDTRTMHDEVGRQIYDLTRSRATSAGLTALIGVAASYLMLTFDTSGSVPEALATSSRLDVDLAIAVLAFFTLHGINHWKADSRELRALGLRRAGATVAA